MKLINATPSPYGRKVAIALKEKGVPYEVQYDIPWVEGTIVPQYSPLQQLPIIVTDDNINVYDSSYLLEWVDLTYPEPAFLPTEVNARLHVLQIRMLAERLAEIAQIIVFEVQRPDPSQAWLTRQTRKIETGLAELSRLIGDRKPALDDTVTLGDIAAGCTLGMFEFIIEMGFADDIAQFGWRERYKNLVEYASALEARPSFQETRPVMFKLNLTEVVE